MSLCSKPPDNLLLFRFLSTRIERLGTQAGLAAFFVLAYGSGLGDNARRYLRKEVTTMITILVLAAATWIGGAGLGV